MIKLLYFSSETLVQSPTLAKSDDGAGHGMISRRTGIDRKAVRNLLDRGHMAQPEMQVTTTKISAPKIGINTKKQMFIKNVPKSDQFD